MRSLRNLAGLVFLMCLTFFLSWSGGSAQMIADITEDVETEFGTYHPYPANVAPCVEPYTVEPDFSNVVNFGDFTFSDADRELLRQNGFVAKPSHYKQIYDIYNECGELMIPAFVTTDAVLHTYHILYDYMLRVLEVQQFVDDLKRLNDAMLANAESMYIEASDPDVKEAARKNVAYFAIGSVLLDSTTVIPTYVDNVVSAERALIEAHQGYEYSPIFCYWEDYSQYIPRGHYTRNDALRAFFKAMMWYGRISFAVRNTAQCPDIALSQTLQAILITQALNNIEIEGEPALHLWATIYDPTVFFVGKTDDLNIYQYTAIAHGIYGPNFADVPVDSLGNDALLNEFLAEADELPDPLITTWTPKGFRFMGQRFIPDSYMFDRLVEPFTPGRYMPKGLDVMAILGSPRAYEILDQVYNETSNSFYVAWMDSLKTEFASMPDSIWAQNLYWNWLYCLMPFLFTKGEGYPPFMQTQAWSDKELSTSLGSWGELRHDTILYAKQSGTEGMPESWFTKGYVEPNPHLYARLASLARFMIAGFETRGLLLDEFRAKLEDLESLLLSLKDISIKELINQGLSHEEYDLLCHFGEIIEGIVTFPPEISGQIENDIDDDMAVIADVHTDAAVTFTCLEEGVGYPLNIFVIVAVEDTVKVTRGAIFSYYEFTQPISERLTDEQWQAIQTSDDPKTLPSWMASFIDTTQSFLNPEPFHYSFHEDMGVLSGGRHGELPSGFSLQQNSPNPFNLATTISYIIPRGDGATSYATLNIYNLFGELVRTLVDGKQPPGYHEVPWDGRDDRGNTVASGVYFYRLKVGELVETKKMVLMK